MVEISPQMSNIETYICTVSVERWTVCVCVCVCGSRTRAVAPRLRWQRAAAAYGPPGSGGRLLFLLLYKWTCARMAG